MPTTVCRLTSHAPAAIAVLELIGSDADELLAACWHPNQGQAQLKINRIRYGYTVAHDPRRSDATQPAEAFDSQHALNRTDAFRNAHSDRSALTSESVVVCKTSPDRIEIHCHGGEQAASSIVAHLVGMGAVEISISQSIDAQYRDEVQREALQDLTLAETVRTTSILLDQFRGALGNEMQSIEALVREGSWETASDRLQQLRDRYRFGRHLIHPMRVVLAGPPNVGKSSLLNRMLGYTRAIVHEHAGTTRDVLMEKTSWDGWPLELTDGAGIRRKDETEDLIESQGIDRTLQVVSQSDCVLLLVDGQHGWTEVHDNVLAQSGERTLLVITKSDVSAPIDSMRRAIEMNSIPKVPSFANRPWFATSAITGQGVEELMNAVVHYLAPTVPIPGDPVPFRARHSDWIVATSETIQRQQRYSVLE